MSTEVLLTVPDEVYDQVEQAANNAERNVVDLLLETITRTFAPPPIDPKRAQMNRNVAAYQSLHVQLVKNYLGQYVAIYQGQLVDHDADPIVLLRRVRAKYPNQVVLRRKVEPVAEREITKSSCYYLEWSCQYDRSPS